MAYEEKLEKIGSLVAAADLRTHQFKLVKLDSNGKVALVSAATDAAIGVLQNKPNTDESAEVGVHGVTKAIAGAAVTRGGELKADASGRVIDIATGVGHRSIGFALEAASAAGEVISVLLIGPVRVLTA